ncbi:TRAP transporter small permease subunit [Aurantimonas aggregata]|uniref:TRAP transporter small permease protein n=1 Tax=Aurantimonas aggregata TaxID=2047720 RepID=A0A6L9MJ97_9HYPH|nr:TRAP transporter small permease subunit [Aurantimonas aggregata]NDV87903.1 TRAP transporter small permease subunit [Aurantimonas aggregata]
MTALIRGIQAVSLWSGRIAALLLLPLVFAMVYEVVSRYVFDAPTQWAFEVSYMMMGTIFLFGLSYALRNNAHVNVDFIHAHLPRRLVGMIDCIAFVAMTGLLVWLTMTLADGVIRTYRTGEGSGLSAWNPLVWPFRLIYALGFGLFALQMGGKVLEALLVILGRPLPPLSGDITVDEKAGAA